MVRAFDAGPRDSWLRAVDLFSGTPEPGRTRRLVGRAGTGPVAGLRRHGTAPRARRRAGVFRDTVNFLLLRSRARLAFAPWLVADGGAGVRPRHPHQGTRRPRP